MKVLTYIINLKKDVARKEHMLKILKPYESSLLLIEWIEAVEGKLLSEEQISESFDSKIAFSRYGRIMNYGEIGCVLSHFKCYENLLSSPNEYALILEDDITLLRKFYWTDEMHNVMNTSVPTILFLSGDYWFYKIKGKGDFKIASVFDAVGAYAYVINKAAARLVKEKNKKISFVSDNWSIYRNQGVTLKAVYPYMIDANIENFVSSVKQNYWGEIRKNMSWDFVIKSYLNAFVKRYLLLRGNFISKIRKE